MDPSTDASANAAPHCEFHPDRKSTARCGGCHRWLCSDCEIVLFGTSYCSRCIYLYQDLPAVFRRLAQETNQKIQLAREMERMEGELRLAQKMQARLLPQSPPGLPNLEIAARSQPCDQVGGDYYDYVALPDGRLALCIGDVTGHGVPAALMMAMVKSSFFTLLAEQRPTNEVTGWLNQTVRTLGDPHQLMTFLYGIVDPAANTFQFCNAGHLYPYVLHGGDGAVQALEADGLPLGGETEPYEERSYTLRKGETLILITDGLVEARNRSGQMLGFDLLEQVLRQAQNCDCQTLVNGLFSTMERFLAGAPREDDTTIVALKLH